MIIRIADRFINMDYVHMICPFEKDGLWSVHIYYDKGEGIAKIDGYHTHKAALEAIENADKIEFTTAHDKELERGRSNA